MSQWFRFYADALEDPKVQKLPAALFKSWVNILCLAAKHDGVLPAVEDIAFALRISTADAVRTVETLAKKRLLDPSGDSYSPHNWDGRQYKSDVSTQRVREHRKRQRNVSPDVTETPPEAETEQKQSRADARCDGYAVWELWQDRRKHHGHGTDAAPPSPKVIATAQSWLDAGAAVPMIRQAFDSALGRGDPPRSLTYCDGAIRDALKVKPVESRRVLSRDEITAGRIKSFKTTGFWDSSWGPQPEAA